MRIPPVSTTNGMEGFAADRHILDWDETDVHTWLSSLGYPQYESQIREHKIQGDSLCDLDSEALKALGITSIGQRLSILKCIYQVKLAHNVPIEAHQYIPPSEATEHVKNISLQIHSIVKDQAQRLVTLEENNWNLNNILQSFMEEFDAVRPSSGQPDEGSSTIRRPPQKSPTEADALESPHPPPQCVELISNYSPNSESPSLPSTSNNPEKPGVTPPLGGVSISSPKPKRHRSSDNLKSFKLNPKDPTWKVLPAALKKYRINNEDWQSYVMVICYGPSGNRVERCLRHDEKPLPLFQKLENAKKDPIFTLKHIKDIRSPIADTGMSNH